MKNKLIYFKQVDPDVVSLYNKEFKRFTSYYLYQAQVTFDSVEDIDKWIKTHSLIKITKEEFDTHPK